VKFFGPICRVLFLSKREAAMIKGIHHASFTISNMERSVAFYRDVLGMEVLWDSFEAGVKYKGEVSDNITGCPGTEQHLVFMGIKGDFLELVEYMPGGKSLEDHKASDVGAGHVCFQTDDIQALYDKLLEHNAVVHCTPQKGMSNRVMYFRDPDGIILEAVEGKTKV
jgi:catechol 2,3-dioxygenase-like lactoylglutathione lyase family enzyme